MSSDTFIAYFGLRFELSADEIEAVELRSDPRIVAARRVGLEYYWGNFGGFAERYLLFVGKKIGIIGPENDCEISISLADKRLAFDDLKEMLQRAGFSGVPEIHISWQPDV